VLDHMILSVRDVERSLAFYEAALKPLRSARLVPPEKRRCCAKLLPSDRVEARAPGLYQIHGGG
jgi:catechol 2,3-dioxygenase-like lactoylglutathione lyase family enzyme